MSESPAMKYGVTFLMLAFGCFVLAVLTWDVVGWLIVLILYAACSFLLLAVAYFASCPGLLMKRVSGCRSIGTWVIFGPYFLLNAVTYGMCKLVSREPPYAQVLPNLFFGRRLSASECTAVPWTGVLDLAAEFAESRPLRELASYKSLPVLDGTCPTDQQLRFALSWIGAMSSSGPVYIHCALGHGRSACVVIAYLLSVGEVNTVESGEQRLQSLRPGVRLSTTQYRTLLQFKASTS